MSIALPNIRSRSSGALEIQCKSWDDFIQQLRLLEANRPGVGTLYRGHSNHQWKLSSPWERLCDHYKRVHPQADARKIFGPIEDTSKDDLFLSVFKEQVKGMPGMPIDMLNTRQDWWAFGRHFGLITPLLDWSQSPFIAAFFALQDRLLSKSNLPERPPSMTSDEPIAVWRLHVYHKLPRKGEFNYVSNSNYEFHRQRIQLGSFTHLDHSKYTDLESYLESRQLAQGLCKYTVPCPSANEANLALSDLDRMNIHSATVFPDAQGAAMYANQAMYWFPLGLKVVGTIGGRVTGSIQEMNSNFLADMLKLYDV
ncbi:MAG: FRG domain-containing protein [Chloroflexi bacterium]|nr:FRG domain-containing protein [Chloroflexota bacterium]